MNTRPGILIVDRDAVAAKALEQQLRAQGYQVQSATSADAALAILHKEQAQRDDATVGVVFVDQDATGTSTGVELIRQLHEHRPSIVPIMTSAFRKVESAVAAMRLGAADYLLKPIVERELLDAVERAVQRNLLLVEHETGQDEIVGKPLDQAHEKIASEQNDHDGHPMPLSEAMKAPERRILLTALKANGWNRGETAKQLDINRTTLYKKIRLHRLDEPG